MLSSQVPRTPSYVSSFYQHQSSRFDQPIKSHSYHRPFFIIELELNLNLIIRKLSRNISQIIVISFPEISKKKKNYELSLVDRNSKIITYNLETSDQTQISHVSVQSKQYSVHPSRETPERKRFSSKFDPQFYSSGSKIEDARFIVFYIQNIEMNHSWFYHFDTRMPKICLFLISFFNGGLFLPLSKKFLFLSMDLKLMRLFRNVPLVHLIYHQFTKISHLFSNFV